MTDLIIREGANGSYIDDGESLRRVDQRGNGSDKALSAEALANRIQSNGD